MELPLVMTVIGRDRPGLVEAIASLVVEHHGNWLESRMCRLGGEFAGILRIQLPAENEPELLLALRKLEEQGINIVVKADHAPPMAGRDGRVGRSRPDCGRGATG